MISSRASSLNPPKKKETHTGAFLNALRLRDIRGTTQQLQGRCTESNLKAMESRQPLRMVVHRPKLRIHKQIRLGIQDPDTLLIRPREDNPTLARIAGQAALRRLDVTWRPIYLLGLKSPSLTGITSRLLKLSGMNSTNDGHNLETHLRLSRHYYISVSGLTAVFPIVLDDSNIMGCLFLKTGQRLISRDGRTLSFTIIVILIPRVALVPMNIIPVIVVTIVIITVIIIIRIATWSARGRDR
mmetsp:Transcript_23854/g.22946  ORF Transcript_23854/g.22946 Transcript_23854/m.22946 type:complete len:242 (+) Transcript_23854:821-1546(+)